MSRNCTGERDDRNEYFGRVSLEETSPVKRYYGAVRICDGANGAIRIPVSTTETNIREKIKRRYLRELVNPINVEKMNRKSIKHPRAF